MHTRHYRRCRGFSHHQQRIPWRTYIRATGLVCQEQAERRLAQELERLEWELERRAHARPLFSDCAKRFLLESKYKRSRADIAWHLGLLTRYVGDLEIRKVHDETLQPLIQARLADGVSATTINRTLEVARTILHRAARAYRDRDGFPWLETAPPLITCCASHLVFRIRSIEMSRIRSFADCLTISPAWRSLPSTPVYVTQTCVACGGRGMCPSPSSVAVYSSFRRKRSNRGARTWSS